MRVLLDESVPRALGFELHGHFVRTAQTAGFSGLSNGILMTAMVAAAFEVLVTFDQNLPFQQNTSLPVAVIVLVAPDNRVTTAQSFVPALLAALASLPPNQVLRLQWGSPDRLERLQAMRIYRAPLPADFKFDRDEANDR